MGERINRRVFIGAAGMGAAALAANPRWAAAQALTESGPFSDYRALVCVFLFGGNDSFNMVVPRSTAEHSVYASSRRDLAVALQDLLPINPIDVGEVQYGLHPAMPELRDLFERGSVALVTNVGPLVQPTTKQSFLDRTTALPTPLFSHNDQQDRWHGLDAPAQHGTGWGGRLADLLAPNVAPFIPVNLSLYNNSPFQTGQETVAYTMGLTGPLPFNSFIDTEFWRAHRTTVEGILASPRDSIYARAFADVQRRAIAAADRLVAALSAAPSLSTIFPRSVLGQQLETVGRLLSVRGSLAARRQIYFVGTAGFDTHDQQLARHGPLLADLSACLSAFHRATVELGISAAVTTFTQSEFGRTLTSNGDGTDHGWGGIQIVLGDAVRGRRFYGEYPNLEIGGPDDAGGGRIIPSVSVSQYAATLARWFGVGDNDLDTLAPYLRNFAEHDLGFLV